MRFFSIKKALLLALIVAVGSCEPAYASVVVVNGLGPDGPGGRPVPGTSNTAVTIIPAGPDITYCWNTEGVDARCNYGSASGAAPAIEPDATHGILFPYVKGLFYCERSAIAHLRLDCAPIGSNANFDTQEEQ